MGQYHLCLPKMWPKDYCKKCEKKVRIWNFECPMGMETVLECLECGHLWKKGDRVLIKNE